MDLIPVAARNADGRIEAFTVVPDTVGSGDGPSGGALWHIWQQTPGGSWGTWFSSGKPSASAGVGYETLCVGSNSDGRLEAFATGTDRALWHIYQLAPNGTWSSWASLAKPPNTSGSTFLGSGTNADGRIEVFTLGDDSGEFGNGNLWHIWQTTPGGSWSSWFSSGKQDSDLIVKPPIVCRNADGRLEVFLLSELRSLWHIWQLTPNGLWSTWTSLGFPPPYPGDDIPPDTGSDENVCVAQNKDGHLEAFQDAIDGALWHIRQQTPGGSWGGWLSLGTPPGVGVRNPYVIANADGRLEAFVIGSDGALWHSWQVTPGGEWGS
jgi:hypothetical protein